MNTYKSVKKLFDAIFGEESTDVKSATVEVKEITVQKRGKDSGKRVIKPRTISTSKGEEELVLEKACLFSHLGIKLPELYTINKSDKRLQLTSKIFWAEKDLVPFGSGIKGDTKNNSKFYCYPTEIAREYFGNQAGDISAYAHKVLVDCKFIKLSNVLVLTYHEICQKLGYNPGFDGSGYGRKSYIPKSSGGFHVQIVGVPERVKNTPKDIPILKGALDPMDDQEFDDLFGVDYDCVVIQKDMIKTNQAHAHTGSWYVGFTYNVENRFDMPLQWEGTQVLPNNDPVFNVLATSQEQAIDKVITAYTGDREQTRNIIDRLINEKDANGQPYIVESKVALVLASDAPFEFAWVQEALEKMMIDDLNKAVRSYGAIAEGCILWTDDKKYKTDPRYLSLAATKAISGDNDLDRYGRFVDIKNKMMLIFRYPVITPVIVHLTDEVCSQLKDHHPEIVELYYKWMTHVSFERDEIKEKSIRIRKGVEYCRLIAAKTMSDTGIGINTNRAKRAFNMFHRTGDQWWLDYAMHCFTNVEAGAIGLKFHVQGIERMEIPEKYQNVKLKEEFPMLYKNAKAEKIADFDKSFGESDLDSRLFTHGYKYIHDRIKNIRRNRISPKMLLIDLSDVGNVSNKFMQKVDDTWAYYVSAISQAFSKDEKGNAVYDEDERKIILSRAVKAVEVMGSQLTVPQLKLAISEAYSRAGDQNSGGFGIHLASYRIPEVFGTSNKITMEQPEIKTFAVKAWTKKNTKVEDIRKVLNKAGFEYDTQQGAIVIGTRPFFVSGSKDMVESVDWTKVSLVTDYKKKDGSVSSRTFWFTLEV